MKIGNTIIYALATIVQLWIVVFAPAKVFAQTIRENQEDLSHSWRALRKNSGGFVEYDGQWKTRAIQWSVDLRDVKGGRLDIEAPDDASLWINGIYTGNTDKRFEIEMDSLAQAHRRNSIEFIVYREAGLRPNDMKTTLYQKILVEEGKPTDRFMDAGFTDFFVLATLVILIYIGVLAGRFPRDTLDYFSFPRSLSLKNREESLISTRPFSRTNLLFVILDSLLIGFLIISMIRLTNGHVHFPLVRGMMTLGGLIINWLFSASIVFLSIVLKYVLIKTFNDLFRLGEFRYIQHFNSLRFSLGAFILTFILVIATYLIFRAEGIRAYFVFVDLLVIMLLMRILITFFKLRDYSSHRNFHLFSYLCGTEVIPFIILYKLVIG